MKRVLVLLCAAAAFAVPAAAENFNDYNGCIRLTQKNPKQALVEASQWQAGGGAAPATHCLALAMIALKRYGDAASRLDSLSKGKGIGASDERAALADQAGNAWLLAGQPRKAVASFTTALSLTPNDVEMHAGRARARALVKDWYGAEADLSAAILIDQDRADLLSLRASARRALGHKTDAASDILRALTLYPDYPAALVERGSMKYEAGDRVGARKDWQKATKGRGDAALAARKLIQEMGPDPKPLTVH
ncbi:MAG: hypothetical protein WCD42_11575 [Rhizomicrobium sp.]